MDNNKEKILVVDDETSIRRILETRISIIGSNFFGKPIHNQHIVTEKGNLEAKQGDGLEVHEIPASIEIAAVVNEEKKIRVEVPLTIMGRKIPNPKPVELA